MPDIASLLFDTVKKIGSSLLPSVKQGFKSLAEKAKGISAKDQMADVVSVLRNTWVFLIFVILTTVIFTALPQGVDILLVVVEDVGVNHNIATLLSLLLSVTFWAVLTEFGARYAIYVSDNSGRNFLEKRVQWRIAIQKVIAAGFLVLPYLSILLSLLILYLNNTSLQPSQRNIGFGVTAFTVYWVFNIVSRPYLDRDFRRRRWENRENSTFWKVFFRPKKEREYTEKLFGIYSNFIFALPKNTWFKRASELALTPFYSWFLRPDSKVIKGFPQDTTYLTTDDEEPITGGKVVDEDFILVYPGTSKPYEERAEEEIASAENDNGYYRWEYIVPNSFFGGLHRQLLFLVITSAIIIVLFSFGFGRIGFYQWIGTPALVFFSFGAWSGIYIGLMFLDKAILRNFPVSIRLLLILWIFICSLINDDHPVRQNGLVCCDNRPSLTTHFNRWADRYREDTTNAFYEIVDSTGKLVQYIRYADGLRKEDTMLGKRIRDTIHPVTFICAEGGALRTGCFAALALANLQDKLKDSGYDFNKTIYAMSGVSGGALGLGYFNAIHYLDDPAGLMPVPDTQKVRSFFSQDYLAPTMGKLLYGDVINLFLPFNWKIDRFDRAIGLEKAWEEGYDSVITPNGQNVFSSDFRSLYCKDSLGPAFFINTTEVESGLQCWITNVKPDSLPLAGQRDLLREKVNKYINYSTAINFSTRFPIISPGGMVAIDDNRKYHYVDGGYVENTGAATMIEILRFLSKDTSRFRYIKPCVLVIKFSDHSRDGFHNLDFGNELTEVLKGIYNTRSGRAAVAEAALEKLTKELGGIYTTFSLSRNGKDVPLNWTFSNQSINNINDDIRDQLRSTNPNSILKKLRFFGRR